MLGVRGFNLPPPVDTALPRHAVILKKCIFKIMHKINAFKQND